MKPSNEFTAAPREFDGKRVLVTGGTKGIGEAVAARLREAGARVLATARTRPRDLMDASVFIATDITTAEGCAAVAEAVLKRLGGVDIIVIPGQEADAPLTLLLLHGTGGDETDLLDVDRQLAPAAALLSPRGKVLEHGMPRYFRRLAEGVFDLEDLRVRRSSSLWDRFAGRWRRAQFPPGDTS